MRVRDLENVHFHDVPPSQLEINGFEISADLITHPGTTLGYRIKCDDCTLAYLPDHEPALGSTRFPEAPEWTSGYTLAKGVDVLIHDAQYTDEEYRDRVGWGHTSFGQLAGYATMTRPERLVTFHHDPAHDDAFLDRAHADLAERCDGVVMTAGTDKLTIEH